MKILKIDLHNPSPDLIQEVADVILSGGLVVHPTDTSYGLAANVFDESAIGKIYTLKGRDFNKPLIVAVKNFSQARMLVEFNHTGEVLFTKFFPGPLTLVLPKKSVVPDIVTGGKPLGIRMPNCPITLALSQISSVPYTTTSANPSGQPSPYSVAEIISQFGNQIENIDLIIDSGTLPRILPSTVVDLTARDAKILRAGPISQEEIKEVLKTD